MAGVGRRYVHARREGTHHGLDGGVSRGVAELVHPSFRALAVDSAALLQGTVGFEPH